jgi:hypothetical protein
VDSEVAAEGGAGVEAGAEAEVVDSAALEVEADLAAAVAGQAGDGVNVAESKQQRSLLR